MKNLLFTLLVFSLVLSGCSRMVKTKGRVVFEEDQTPLTCGVLILQTETYQAKGEIQADGTFRISSVNPNDGLPPGKYRGYITGAVAEPETAFTQETDPSKMRGTPRNPQAGPTPLIDAKYGNIETSGIVYDTADGSRLDIMVSRPGR